mmetsp:Transcript_111200/g.192883  ORF Transcript_111200/g.192883 Transcript_111200/m.192883 type:complete len:91 (-) Transcript_111200:180-452(-)
MSGLQVISLWNVVAPQHCGQIGARVNTQTSKVYANVASSDLGDLTSTSHWQTMYPHQIPASCYPSLPHYGMLSALVQRRTSHHHHTVAPT